MPFRSIAPSGPSCDHYLHELEPSRVSAFIGAGNGMWAIPGYAMDRSRDCLVLPGAQFN